jgi:hypothetical protein
VVWVNAPVTKRPPFPVAKVGALVVPGGAKGVTAVVVTPAGPAPALLLAMTEKLYDVVEDKPVQVTVVPELQTQLPVEP